MKRRYTEKCDIWSVGVILYVLLCGTPPFFGENDSVIVDKIEAGKFSFDGAEWQGVSEESKDLIKKLLTYDPNQRVSAGEALQHPWFKKVLGENAIDKPLAVSALTHMKEFRVMRGYENKILGSKQTPGGQLAVYRQLSIY